MKVILTGATGWIGGEVLEQCIAHPQITSIVVLSRRALSGPVARNPKVSTIILQDFLKYPSSVTQQLKGAELCIWSLGTYSGGEDVEAGYPLAFCDAMSSVRAEPADKPFRMVYLSGMFVRTDQDMSLWFKPVTRKAKGAAETKLFAVEEKQTGTQQPWESYVVRPGGVLWKAWGMGILTALFGTNFLIKVDVLAAAMIDTAINGDSERRLYHSMLSKKGNDALKKLKASPPGEGSATGPFDLEWRSLQSNIAIVWLTAGGRRDLPASLFFPGRTVGRQDLDVGTMDDISVPEDQRPLLGWQSNQARTGTYVDMDKDIETRKDPAGLIATASIDDINAEARTAADEEHGHSFFQAVKLYPAAVGWSLFFSLGVIMCAFDPQLLGQLYATPAFQRDFGYLYDGNWIISAPWQTGLSMGSPIGQVVGAFASAYPMEWWGRKKTFGGCVILTTGFIFIQFFARSLPVLLVGELLGGLVLGCYAVIAPAYASEVCPLALRGVLTSCTNICFVTGQLIANGIIAGTHVLDSHWAYSAPFAAQWVWPLIILIGLPFAPESPWWLQRQGRFEDAEKALKRLASPGVDVKPTLAMIIETDRLEREIESGSTYRDCFKKINIRRTEIAVGVYTIQVLSGIYLVGYATYFFTLAGLPTDQAFNMGVGFLAVGFVGTCLSWILLVYFGRRRIYNIGLASLAVLQIIIGILDCVPNYENRPSLAWAQSVLMLVWNFIYDLSIGPVCFVLLCEVSATRVRSKTIAIATAVQATAGIVMTVAIPYLINADQANLRGKLGFFYGGLAALCLLWSYFRVPELKGRTYQEVDIMFERNLKTRDFKNYVITR